MVKALRSCLEAEGPESKGPKNPWTKKGVQPVTGMGVAGSGRLAYILQRAHSFVASKYCKWRKGSRPRKGSRSVAWLDGMVETLVRPAKLWSLHHIPGYRIFWVRCKALKPTSDSNLP